MVNENVDPSDGGGSIAVLPEVLNPVGKGGDCPFLGGSGGYDYLRTALSPIALL